MSPVDEEAVVSKLEEEARKRKDRLQAMKRKVNDRQDGNDDLDDTEPKDKLKPPSFRSYKPSDNELQSAARSAVKPADVQMEIEQHIADSKDTTVADDIDISTLAPRKIDWDLKRDAAKKLEKLERRTQRAIAELIRERLASGNQDLLSAVNSGTAAAQLSDDDFDD